MSSKFNIHPRPMLRPSICKAPHGSCWPPWPIDQPLLLQAYMDLYDLDPLDPIGASGYTIMPMIDPTPIYDGISPEAPNRLRARIFPAGPPNQWNVEATLYPPSPTPGYWYWYNVYVDPTRSFDTGLLRHVIIPNMDYQNVRITS